MVATCNRLEIYAEVDRFHGSMEEVSRLLVERSGESSGVAGAAPLRPLRRGAVAHLFHVAVRARLDGRRRGPDPRPDPRRPARRPGARHGRPRAELPVPAGAPGRQAGARRDRHRPRGAVDGPARPLAVLPRPTPPTRSATSASSSSARAPWPRWRRRPSPGSARPGSPWSTGRAEARRRLAVEHGAEALPLTDLEDALADADVVITCAGATGLLVTRDMVETALSGRPADRRGLLVVDLALPHDVEPTVPTSPA